MPADLVQSSLQRLGRDTAIDAGLRSLLDTARSSGDSDPFTAVQQDLRIRLEDLGHAANEMQNLSRSIRRLRRIYPYTEEGWPAERRRLERLVETEPDIASSQWLGHVAATAGAARLPALRRLVEDGPLPAAHERLRDRTAACLGGLTRRSYPIAAPLLRTCLSMRADRSLYLTAGTIRRLVLLLARLALADGNVDEAEALLAEEAEVPGAARLALRAAAVRHRGDLDGARRLLTEARAANARDLDVVAESLRWGDLELDRAEAIAGAAIQAVTCFFDIDHDLEPLIDAPAQLWIAVAERALDDDDQPLADHALDRAEAAARPEEWDRVQARASGMRSVWLEGNAKAEALLSSGISWLAAGDMQATYDAFDRALQQPREVISDSLWATLSFRRADSFAVLMFRFPERYSRRERLRALDALLAAQRVEGALAASPWAYGVESDLRTGIADLVGEKRDAQVWGAIQAAARTVALRLGESRAWSTLTGVVGAWGRHELAADFANYAIRHLGDDPESLTMNLVNARDYDAALEKLSGETNAWHLCVTGWVWCRQGRVEEAANLLATTTIDPDWFWAKDALVCCHLMLGHVTEAMRLAKVYLSDLPEPVEELGRLVAKAKLFLVLGDLDHAEECASRAARSELGGEFDESDGTFLLAQIDFLRHRGKDSNHSLTAAAGSRHVTGLKDWALLERPTLEALARLLGVSEDGLDGLDEVDEVVSRRLRDVANAAVDPALDTLPPATCDPGFVGAIQQLVRALRAVAIDDLDAAEDEVGGLPPKFADEARAVLEYVASERTVALVGELGTALGEGDESRSADLLRSLAGVDLEPVGLHLRQRVTQQEVDGETVRACLTALAADPRLTESLDSIRAWLPMDAPVETSEETAPAEPRLQLGLPTSWFEDYSDPRLQHPLLNRYLPEARASTPWEIPAVSVFTGESLEPDHFVVLDDGDEVLDSGVLARRARLCDRSTLPGLPARLREAAFETSVGWWVPDDAFTLPKDWVHWLATMDPDEAAVSRVREVARRLLSEPVD